MPSFFRLAQRRNITAFDYLHRRLHDNEVGRHYRHFRPFSQTSLFAIQLLLYQKFSQLRLNPRSRVSLGVNFTWPQNARNSGRTRKLRPLSTGAFSGSVGLKWPRDGKQEHFCAILEGKITCNTHAYWLSSSENVAFPVHYEPLQKMPF